MPSTLWVVSAPNEGGRNAFKQMQGALDTRGGLCAAYRLPLPPLRVGTLDSLLAVSDAIARDDKQLESVVDRVLRQFRDLAPAGAGTPLVDDVDVLEYATDFEWDEAKFASTDSLADLRKTIMEQVARLEEEMKIRSGDYTTTKQALAAIARKSQGNLMARGLSSIVTAADVTESEHLTTAFVVFPAYMADEFLECYEELAELVLPEGARENQAGSSFPLYGVVPRSARMIKTESDYALYGVTVFKNSMESFKSACRDRRYTVRDYTFEAGADAEDADEEARLTEEAEEQHLLFAKWSETAFRETFIAMTHLKALRVFVESVLRYGLPVNFEVALLKPKSKSDARLRSALNEMFGHLGGSWAASQDDENVPGLGADKDFYPYVYMEMPIPEL